MAQINKHEGKITRLTKRIREKKLQGMLSDDEEEEEELLRLSREDTV